MPTSSDMPEAPETLSPHRVELFGGLRSVRGGRLWLRRLQWKPSCEGRSSFSSSGGCSLPCPMLLPQGESFDRRVSPGLSLDSFVCPHPSRRSVCDAMAAGLACSMMSWPGTLSRG